jgi:putative hydrolase of the HAD superfamily
VTTAVVFDLFGTLTGFESERNAHAVILADELGIPVEELTAQMFATYDERARGKSGGVRDQIVTLVERLGGSLSPQALERALEIRMASQAALLRPRSGAIEVLTALRAHGLGIGVLSDCTNEIPELWSSSAYADLVDSAIFSCVLGVRKPDPRTYDAVLAGLGVRAEETLYVGDGGSSELSGAKLAGLRPVLLNVAGENHLRYEAEIGWQGESISDLAEVLDLVGV